MNTVADLTVGPEPGHHHCGPRHRLYQQPLLAGQQGGWAAVVDTLCGVRCRVRAGWLQINLALFTSCHVGCPD